MADESTVGNDNVQAQCEGLLRLEGALGEDHPWVRLSRHVLHVDKLREIQVEALRKITKRGECHTIRRRNGLILAVVTYLINEHFVVK